MTDPKALQELAAKVRRQYPPQADSEQIAQALVAYACILAVSTDTREIEERHAADSEFPCEKWATTDIAIAHENRAFLLDANRKLRAELDQKSENRYSHLVDAMEHSLTHLQGKQIEELAKALASKEAALSLAINRMRELVVEVDAAKEIITRAEDLRRRAEELDEEFNHDEGSTVENALSYVLGKEPAESCIILQMHIEAAGN